MIGGGIRYLEAHLIELLANAVTEGIVRLEHEAESGAAAGVVGAANLCLGPRTGIGRRANSVK